MPASIAENHFTKFTGDDAATVLSGLPHTHPKTFEDQWLDFKSGKPGNDDKIREIWSKAVGAMANAEGGVIVWGLMADKHGSPPVDAVKGVELVEDVSAFKSKLNEALHFITDPPVIGVRIEAIPIKPMGKEGFVVCLVPEQATKPYQSLKTKRPFYIRMNDESREPSLSLLRQLFYPRIMTKAKVDIRISDGHANIWKLDCTLIISGASSIEAGTVRVESPFAPISLQPGLGGYFRGPAFFELPSFLHPSQQFNFLFHIQLEDFHVVAVPVMITLYQRNQEAKQVEFQFSPRTGILIGSDPIDREKLSLSFP